MTPIELLRECKRVDAMGLRRMVICVPRRKRRPRTNRVRVLPGVIGTICGGDRERLMVWVELADLVAALERVMVPK